MGSTAAGWKIGVGKLLRKLAVERRATDSQVLDDLACGRAC
jgi:hypothetical protein